MAQLVAEQPPVKQKSRRYRIRIGREHGVTVLRRGLSEEELREWVESWFASTTWATFTIEEET